MKKIYKNMNLVLDKIQKNNCNVCGNLKVICFIASLATWVHTILLFLHFVLQFLQFFLRFLLEYFDPYFGIILNIIYLIYYFFSEL